MVFFHESGKRHTFEGQRVTHLDHIVSRAILLAKLPGNKHRCEVAKELRAHLDDLADEVRSQGYDNEAAARIIRMRFGEPQEIAAAFSSVYAPERWARRILQSTILFAASTIAVVVVIGTVQSITAMWTADSIWLRRDCGGLLQSVRWRAALFVLARVGAFAKRYSRFRARRSFRLADSSTYGIAVSCLCVCCFRSPSSTLGDTFHLVCRNRAAATDSMGVVWSTPSRLAVPMVGVVRLDNFL
jgi:hypothetical protein